MNRKDYREWEKHNQYNIPRRLEYYAEQFNLVTWKQAIALYANSVALINTIHNIETIIDLPFGKGYRLVEDLWLEMMKEAQKVAEKKLEEKDEIDYCGDEDFL